MVQTGTGTLFCYVGKPLHFTLKWGHICGSDKGEAKASQQQGARERCHVTSPTLGILTLEQDTWSLTDWSYPLPATVKKLFIQQVGCPSLFHRAVCRASRLPPRLQVLRQVSESWLHLESLMESLAGSQYHLHRRHSIETLRAAQ